MASEQDVLGLALGPTKHQWVLWQFIRLPGGTLAFLIQVRALIYIYISETDLIYS